MNSEISLVCGSKENIFKSTLILDGPNSQTNPFRYYQIWLIWC